MSVAIHCGLVQWTINPRVFFKSKPILNIYWIAHFKKVLLSLWDHFSLTQVKHIPHKVTHFSHFSYNPNRASLDKAVGGDQCTRIAEMHLQREKHVFATKPSHALPVHRSAALRCVCGGWDQNFWEIVDLGLK